MKTPQDKYIQVGQINTRYWAEGDRGSPIVLIHGLGSYVESWLSSFTSLNTEHRVYAMDLPGQGRTEKPLNISYTIKDFAQFVKDFMAALKIERAHVVGSALGGAISTRLALMFPEAVDKLVLVSSGGLGKKVSLALRICAIPLLGEFLTRPSLAGKEQFLKTLVHDPSVITREIIEQNYQMSLLPGAQKAFLKILRTNINPLFGQTHGATTRELGTITSPTLIIWGQQDPAVPVSHADIAAKSFPDVHVQVIDNCGHLPMVEHMQAFNNFLVDFLK